MADKPEITTEAVLGFPVEDLNETQAAKYRSVLAAAVNELTSVLKDESKPAAERREALDAIKPMQAKIAEFETHIADLSALADEAAALSVEDAPAAEIVEPEVAPEAPAAPAATEADKELVTAAQQAIPAGSPDAIIDAPKSAPVAASLHLEADANHHVNSLADLGRAVTASFARSNDIDRAIVGEAWDNVDSANMLSASNGLLRNGQLAGLFPEYDDAGVAAAFCYPPEFEREIPFCSRQDTPVADSLTSVPMARGQIAIPREIGLKDASFDWTYGNPALCPPAEGEEVEPSDQNLADYNDPSTWKGECATVDCPEYEAFALEAEGWCLEVCRDQDLSNPEGVQRTIQAVMAGYARHSEAKLLEKLKARAIANGTSYSYGPVMSAGPDLATALEGVMSEIVSHGRISLGNYQAIISEGMESYVNLENYKRADCCDVSASQIFSGMGVAGVTQTPDWATSCLNPLGAAPIGTPGATVPIGGPLVGPRVYDVYLYDSTKTRLGVGQTFSIGTGTDFRDWGMVRTNCRAMFFETERQLIFSSCVPVIHLQLTLCPTGARAGYLEPACA